MGDLANASCPDIATVAARKKAGNRRIGSSKIFWRGDMPLYRACGSGRKFSGKTGIEDSGEWARGGGSFRWKKKKATEGGLTGRDDCGVLPDEISKRVVAREKTPDA